MSEPDKTRAAFDALRKDVMPAIRKPGFEATRRTVRHRHVRNTILSALAIIAVVAGLFFLPSRLLDRPVPPIDVSPSPSASASIGPQAAPDASASPTASPATTACTSDPIGVYSGNLVPDNAIRVRYKDVATGSESMPLCQGVRLKLLWATYQMDAQGVLHLIQSGQVYIDSDHPQRTVKVTVTPGCTDSFFTVSDVPIPEALDHASINTMQSRGGPFWDYRHNTSGLAYRGSCDRP